MNITIISGSIRNNRNSHRVSLYLEKRFNSEAGIHASIIDLNALNIPLLVDNWDKIPEYDAHAEAVVKQLEQSDAFIWLSPEYNGSYTPALKNFVDHFPLKVFKNKPVGAVSVSTGSIGGIRGGMQLQQLALAVMAYAVPQMLLVPSVTYKFSEEGELLDESFQRFVNLFVNDVLWVSKAFKQSEQKV
jgi:NAD(P)H-dependent FMN reductase